MTDKVQISTDESLINKSRNKISKKEKQKIRYNKNFHQRNKKSKQLIQTEKNKKILKDINVASYETYQNIKNLFLSISMFNTMIKEMFNDEIKEKCPEYCCDDVNLKFEPIWEIFSKYTNKLKEINSKYMDLNRIHELEFTNEILQLYHDFNNVIDNLKELNVFFIENVDNIEKHIPIVKEKFTEFMKEKENKIQEEMKNYLDRINDGESIETVIENIQHDKKESYEEIYKRKMENGELINITSDNNIDDNKEDIEFL